MPPVCLAQIYNAHTAILFWHFRCPKHSILANIRLFAGLAPYGLWPMFEGTIYGLWSALIELMLPIPDHCSTENVPQKRIQIQKDE